MEVAPSTLTGEPTGTAIRARTTLLDGREAFVAAKALARSHRILKAVVVPIAHRVMGYGRCTSNCAL